MRTKIYVGIASGVRCVFRSAVTPTPECAYVAVIGPFKTLRAAKLMADQGPYNPHLQTVADAERIAAQPHQYVGKIAVAKSNKARAAILEVTDDYVLLQWWSGQDKVTPRDFAIRFDVVESQA